MFWEADMKPKVFSFLLFVLFVVPSFVSAECEIDSLTMVEMDPVDGIEQALVCSFAKKKRQVLLFCDGSKLKSYKVLKKSLKQEVKKLRRKIRSRSVSRLEAKTQRKALIESLKAIRARKKSCKKGEVSHSSVVSLTKAAFSISALIASAESLSPVRR